MKTYAKYNRIRLAAIAMAAGGLLASCVEAKDPYNPTGGNENRYGTMSVSSLGREGDFIVVESDGATKADAAAVPDVGTFRVAVLDSKGENVVHDNINDKDYRWNTFAEVEGQLVTIPSGKYKLEAASLTDEPQAAWETPYYYGVQDFTVRISELTDVSLVCKLANVKVTVEYDQEFLDKVDNPQVQVYFDYTDETAQSERGSDLVLLGDPGRIFQSARGRETVRQSDRHPQRRRTAARQRRGADRDYLRRAGHAVA